MTREDITNSQDYKAEGVALDWYKSLNAESVGEIHITDAYADGVVYGWNNPHWIPVENYPKDDISCTLLVHYVDGTIDICDYYGDYYDYTGQNVTRNVTHWMPLPPPPRKEENDE